MATAMTLSFSSWNSTAKSSALFCRRVRPVSRSVRSEGSKPGEAGSELCMLLFSVDEDPQQDADAESDANGLVGMVANHAIGGPGAGRGLFLNVIPGGFPSGANPAGSFLARLRHFSGGGFDLLARLAGGGFGLFHGALGVLSFGVCFGIHKFQFFLCVPSVRRLLNITLQPNSSLDRKQWGIVLTSTLPYLISPRKTISPQFRMPMICFAKAVASSS